MYILTIVTILMGFMENEKLAIKLGLLDSVLAKNPEGYQQKASSSQPKHEYF